MKNILLIGTTNIYGGVGHMIFEFCKYIDKDAVHFDFLYYNDISEEEQTLIDSYNGTFYKVPRYSRHPIQFLKKIKSFFNTHQYDAVHIHASTAMLIVYALPVWKSKNTKIIYQSHSNLAHGFMNNFLHEFFKRYVLKYTDYKIAVSKKAAQFMYGKNYISDTIILKNGIDIEKYMFSENTREKIRRELKIEDEFVLGHVGRFVYPKNHPFIIEVFGKLHEIDKNTKLLLVGYGENESKIRQMVQEKGLTASVIFYGVSNCVEEPLCAMDCFIFPSKFEGLGIVALEAQANGLPVLASTNVPQEANITDSYKSLSLIEDSCEIWAKTILSFIDKNMNRKLNYQELTSSGYDIVKVAKELEKIYMEI